MDAFDRENAMRILIAGAMLAAVAWAANAGASQESCEEMRKVNGRMAFVSVPCAKLEHEEVCYDEKTDAQGRITQTTAPCPTGKGKTVEQRQREEDAVKKRKCGKDFMALRVGMTRDRFEECNEGLSYVTETTDKDGLIETYRSTFYYVHFSKDRVVSYTRRTR